MQKQRDRTLLLFEPASTPGLQGASAPKGILCVFFVPAEQAYLAVVFGSIPKEKYFEACQSLRAEFEVRGGFALKIYRKLTLDRTQHDFSDSN